MHLNYQTKQSHDGAKFELVSNEVNDKDNKLAHEIHEQDEFERLLFDGADALRKVGSHMNANETLCQIYILNQGNKFNLTNLYFRYRKTQNLQEKLYKQWTGSGESFSDPTESTNSGATFIIPNQFRDVKELLYINCFHLRNTFIF